MIWGHTGYSIQYYYGGVKSPYIEDHVTLSRYFIFPSNRFKLPDIQGEIVGIIEEKVPLFSKGS